MSFSSGLPAICRRMSWKSWGRISSRFGGHAVAEGRDQLRELLDPLRVRLLVDAVEGGHAGFESRSATASLAASMNSSMTRMLSSRSRGHDAGHLARGVQDQLRLGQVEVQRPALVAPLAHQLRQLVHALEERRPAARSARAGPASPSTIFWTCW